MNDTQVETIEQIEAFLSGTLIVDLIIEDKADRYVWIQSTLIRLHYPQLRKAKKGIVMRYLGKMTGYSPAQVKRLIKQLDSHKLTAKKERQYYPLHRCMFDEKYGRLQRTRA